MQVAVVVVLAAFLVAVTGWSAYTLRSVDARQLEANGLQRDLVRHRDRARQAQVRFWQDYATYGPTVRRDTFAEILSLRQATVALAARERAISPGGPGDSAADRAVAGMYGIITDGLAYLGEPDPAKQRVILKRALGKTGAMQSMQDAVAEWNDIATARAQEATTTQSRQVHQLIVRVSVLLVLLVVAGVAGYVQLGRRRAQVVARFHAVAREQAALRRVATEVAEQTDPGTLFGVLADEMVRLLDADAGFVCRTGRRSAHVLGASSPDWMREIAMDPAHAEIAPDSAIGRAMRTGAPVRVSDYAHVSGALAQALHRAGVHTSVAAPVMVGGRPWGIVAAVARTAGRLPAGVEERLAPFARLAGVAIENAEVRAQLAERATTDALTGLPNHGAFHERLGEELARCAAEPDHRFALVVMDIDRFKTINDTHGHPVGDRVLVETAHRLRSQIRDGEMLARVGGEEFAWILPDTDGSGAWSAALRARAAVSASPVAGVGVVTVSAGVCDRATAPRPDEVYRLADAALLAAKAAGRDRAVLHSPPSPTREADPAGSRGV